MNKKVKKYILICLIVLACVLGLMGLVFLYNKKKSVYYHKRSRPYQIPMKEKIDIKIRKNLQLLPKNNFIPKVVYMTYHDLDGIPPYVIENIKKYCKGYKIEIHGDQSCEDFLYEYYGPDAMQLFRELKLGPHKADFWRYCILYVKGGYYFDIKTNFKKHIDEIFKINDKKTWSTVLCADEGAELAARFSLVWSRCIFNGVIVTPARNPVLWEALKYCHTHVNPHYLAYVDQLYIIVQKLCSTTLHVGVNPQSNGWSCLLLKESCDMHCKKKGHGSCGHDGRDCKISNANGQEVIQTRYIDFPWSKSSDPNRIRLLQINPSGKTTEEYNKTSMVVITSFPYHFECLGVILDMTKDKYKIDFYGPPDTEGYTDYFHTKYDFRSFLLNRSNLDEGRYDHIVKLTSNDPYKVKDLSKLVQIQHVGDLGGPTPTAITIRLSPLVLQKSNIKTLISIFEGDNLPQRRNQIIVIGEWVDGPLQSLIRDFQYKIVLVRRKPRRIDKAWCNSPNIECVYSPSTEKLINMVKVSKFIYIHQKDDRFSGAITLALSFHVPMIIDEAQASVYDFPCFTYVYNVAELAPRLNNIGVQEYTDFLQKLGRYTKEKRDFNRENVYSILCTPEMEGTIIFGHVGGEILGEQSTVINTRYPDQISGRNYPSRIIHRTFRTFSETMKLFGKAWTDTSTNLPDWKQIFYSDTDVEEWIRAHFGPSSTVDKAYHAINPVYGAARADLFRYLVVYIHGGLYIDIKSSALKSPPKFPQGTDILVSPWETPYCTKQLGPEGEMQNWYIYARPRSKVLAQVIKHVISNIANVQVDPYGASCLTLIRNGDNDMQDTVLGTTGPAAFTIALREYEKVRHREDKDVTKVRPNLDGTLTYDHKGGHEKLDSKYYTKQKGVLILPNSPKIMVKELERLNVDLQQASQRASHRVYLVPRYDRSLLPPCFTSDYDYVELGERIVAGRFTRPDACVLEFGGGCGAVSTVIQRILSNPRNHVVIQPDQRKVMFGGSATLTKNKLACGNQYHIVDHILKAGEDQEIQRLVSKPFDTLVVDCEGCLVGEYKKNPNLFNHITMIQVERDDMPGMLSTPVENYESLFIKLGFKKIHSGEGCDGRCPTEVWVRSLKDNR